MLKHRKCTGHLVTGGGAHFRAVASFIHSLKAKESLAGIAFCSKKNLYQTQYHINLAVIVF